MMRALGKRKADAGASANRGNKQANKTHPATALPQLQQSRRRELRNSPNGRPANHGSGASQGDKKCQRPSRWIFRVPYLLEMARLGLLDPHKALAAIARELGE